MKNCWRKKSNRSQKIKRKKKIISIGHNFLESLSSFLIVFRRTASNEIFRFVENKDFQNVYNNGVSFANRYLVMYVLKNNTENNRIGISVSKKVGNSVIRHHITRLVRELQTT